MCMTRKKYYVSMKSSEISQVKFDNNTDFIIYATEDEVTELRNKMESMYDADFQSFWRSHVPFVPYHNDQANDAYDMELTEAFQMIHDLGNEQTRTHIRSMGLLGDRHM